MSDKEFTDLASADEIPPKGFIVRVAGETEVVLARFRDEIYAVENLCSHAFARFNDGRLRGNRLMCPLHGACFNIIDGTSLGPPASRPIRSFPVRVEAGRVLAAID
ncbi:MAG: Rieske 2Fe-2S domain-containing protein [Woeseiaceae bacterium]|nr:Rieske 2Fe-2S domain-containing protein [Woeseiaceae bacterium]